MRRIVLAIVLMCLTLPLMAQNGIKVNYKGSKPTVTDFAWAAFTVLNSDDEEECGDRPWGALEYAMELNRKGLPQEEGDRLIIDVKNGYIQYESVGDGDIDHIFRLEVCFWNEKDGKHKLIAFNDMASFTEGKPCVTETTSMFFFRYDNATKRMVACDPPGFEVDYSCTYELPRDGKDIVCTKWDDNDTTSQYTLKWNGRRFSR